LIFQLLLLVSLVVDDSLCTIRFTVKVPDYTPEDNLYIASNYNGWNPGDPGYRMNRTADGSYQISITVPKNFRLEYKFTRGSWITVEKGISGEEIPNRIIQVIKDTALEIEIGNWRDFVEKAVKSHTITGNVQVIEFESRFLKYYNPRRIWIYLPPDYSSSKKTYSVLYMQDGQNLFDEFESFAGEWNIDETLERMHSESGFSLIVVGIENAREHRIEEYSPYLNKQLEQGGQALDYINFIVRELKPYIDSTYRTKHNDTGILGSSLGGLVSIFAGYIYPQVFKKVGSMSGAFWFNPDIVSLVADSKATPEKIYIDYGLLEGDDPERYIKGNELICEAILKSGVRNSNLMVVKDPEGVHHESSWAKRFGTVVQFLFKN